MATPVLMPKQGNTVEECILVSWKKKKGEAIASGEVLASIETDKASFDIEAPVAGTVLETFYPEGALVPVLQNIAVIGNPGEATAEFAPKSAPKAAAAKSPSPASSNAPAARAAAPVAAPITLGTAPQAPAAQQEAAGVSPRARALAKRLGVDVMSLSGSGVRGRVSARDVEGAPVPRLSSVAKALLEEGKRLPKKGSGPGGLIRGEDMLEPGTPLSNIRKVVAARMAQSLGDTAQFTAHSSADASGMLKLRAYLKKNAAAKNLPDLTLNDMVMFATVKALLEHPEVNAEYIQGEVYQHKKVVHLGFACDTPRGLMVPVVKDAHTMDPRALATRIKELAKAAVDGKISPDDLSGGTFTVSNLGGFGVEMFTPIINVPQVAILGICGTSLKPKRVDGQVVFVDHMGLSLTSDHQIVDGAPAARFLQTVIKKIEDIVSLTGIAIS